MPTYTCEWCGHVWGNPASADMCCSDTRWGDDD